jgi:hypothetical protein
LWWRVCVSCLCCDDCLGETGGEKGGKERREDDRRRTIMSVFQPSVFGWSYAVTSARAALQACFGFFIVLASCVLRWGGYGIGDHYLGCDLLQPDEWNWLRQ